MAYGVDQTRYEENKRAVDEKYVGPLIKTIMTRCIHCTRCVRFSTEVAGVEDLGAIGRGEDMEITTYLERAIGSELSGNLIDLCPVGALTSKPYAFNARPWELRKTESIDVSDATGSNIRVDARGRQVMRVLPRLHEDVNEEWISDKARFACDGLVRQRLDRPYVRRDGKLAEANWDEAFKAVAKRIEGADGGKLAAIAGDLACVESVKALKDLMGSLDCANIDCRQDGGKLGEDRASYLFNPGIAGIDEADAVLIVGSNPRLEAPVLNARLRRLYRMGRGKIGVIGTPADLTYPVEYLGAGPQTLSEIANGSHPFAEVLKTAKRPLVIVGAGAVGRDDGKAVLSVAAKIAEQSGALGDDWCGFGVLHTAASRVGGLDLGFLPGPAGKDVAGIIRGAQSGDIETVFLLGADELEWGDKAAGLLGDAFVVYVGSHGDRGAHRADVILPAAAYTEKSATWVNTEGRVQITERAVFPPGDAREDWTIFRALSEKIGKKLPYDDLAQLRRAIIEQAPHFADVDALPDLDSSGVRALTQNSVSLGVEAFEPAITDFYLTNPIARASETMAQCSSIYSNAQEPEATGTDG